MHRGGFEPSAFEIGHVEVTIPDLDPAFRGYRIASMQTFIWMNGSTRRVFDEVIDLINQQHPDLVAIVGDLFSYEVDGLSQQMVVSLNKLRPKDCSVCGARQPRSPGRSDSRSRRIVGKQRYRRKQRRNDGEQGTSDVARCWR